MSSVATVAVAVLAAQFVHGLATNPFYQWDRFGYWFARPVVLRGLWVTLEVTALSWCRDVDPAEARECGVELLTRVGLAGKASAYPRQLSGGQQQRVAIARALALRPGVMLFDEPTSALDPELVGEVLATIRDLAGGGATMIVVTHEIGFAREAADVVAFMDGGRIVEQGPPADVLDRPREPCTREFLSKVL